MISSEFPPSCGGIGHYVYYLSRELINAGNDVSVILSGKKDKTYFNDKIQVKELGLFGRSPMNRPIFRRRLNKLIARDKPDIVHLHYGALPHIQCDCPVIVTAHWCSREGIPIFYRPIRNLDAFLKNILLPLYIRIESNFFRSFKNVFVVSNSLREELKKHYNVNSDVIGNGVDVDKFNENNTVKKDFILYTGKFDFGKGLIDLLEIAEMLKESHPDVKVIMIGNGSIKKKIDKIIRKKKLFNVKVLNHLPHDELLEYYRCSKVYVLPSYYEGLPTTILEAMACKLPVVASNISGIPELVEEGVTGYMLSPGDKKGFYRRIVELHEDPEKRKFFGEKGRERVMEKFTWSGIAKNMVEKYEELLRNKMLLK